MKEELDFSLLIKLDIVCLVLSCILSFIGWLLSYNIEEYLLIIYLYIGMLAVLIFFKFFFKER